MEKGAWPLTLALFPSLSSVRLIAFLLFLCQEENRWIIQETLSLRTVHTDVGSDPELLFRIVFVVCPVSEDVSRSLLLSVRAVSSCVDVPSETVRPVCRPH